MLTSLISVHRVPTNIKGQVCGKIVTEKPLKVEEDVRYSRLILIAVRHPSSESERSSACEYQCYLTYLRHTSKTTNMVSTSGLVFVLLALAVGREGVLSASSARELRCGRRLVSGLFSRPRLPLGYSYVTTVPRGACRLNVSEITPTDNYIGKWAANMRLVTYQSALSMEWTCTGNCTSGSSTGVQRRSVVCARLDAGAASDTECGPAPRAARACDPPCGTNNTPPLSIGK
ncbi:unnamed protein product [Chrysodeixis includens]|uniref:Uncharacterized protein n=1 Tax=Chrysodeixis includens TaxID=689277 RepID=A0A9P0BRA3_CHRIL|nr:unnamed protein product [Chrysodeixis includens]